MIRLSVNGQSYNVDVTPDMPLLWVLRDEIGLTGTKYGCGVAQCGACTVHINGEPVRSCQQAVGDIGQASITTIDSREPSKTISAVQKAWIESQVAQCGYCQSGQIMQAAGLLDKNTQPSDNDIDEAMSGNLCRCGTYPRIRKAIKAASHKLIAG